MIVSKPCWSMGALLCIASSAFAHATPCPGQALTRAIRLTDENDYFDFLLPPRVRPDDNYTQGFRASWDADLVPPFARSLLCPQRRACGSTFELGQEMYTPAEDAVQPIPGQRPYAGWLYLRASATAASTRMRQSVGVTLGVTGAASLAAQTQEAFHHLIHGFRRPIGWSNQLPTEPDFAVGAETAWYLHAPGRAARWADVVPAMHAVVGTLRTALGASARVRVGFPLSHPWLMDAGARRWEVYIFAGGQVEAVGRDLFLDGATFHRSVHVERQPLVTDWERGIGVRLWHLGLEYRLVTQGREYRGGPAAHPFGGINISWRTVR